MFVTLDGTTKNKKISSWAKVFVRTTGRKFAELAKVYVITTLK